MSRRPRQRTQRLSAARESGFTLFELIVSTGVLMIVMLFALQMLGEAGRLHGNAQIEFAEPSLDLVERWLRRDSQGASGVNIQSRELETEPLELWGNVEGIIRYEKLGSNLDRVLMGAEGEELGRRTVMRGVLEFEWRVVNTTMVQVELLHEGRVPGIARPGRGSPAEFRLYRESYRFMLRGVPRSHW